MRNMCRQKQMSMGEECAGERALDSTLQTPTSGALSVQRQGLVDNIKRPWETLSGVGPNIMENEAL